MTKSVWKFGLMPFSDVIKIDMPKDAKVLFAAVQNENPFFWAEVTPQAPMETREFRAYGTGHILPDDPGRYLGTVMLYKGELVYHIYE